MDRNLTFEDVTDVILRLRFTTFVMFYVQLMSTILVNRCADYRKWLRPKFVPDAAERASSQLA